jgi:hypothetical protein
VRLAQPTSQRPSDLPPRSNLQPSPFGIRICQLITATSGSLTILQMPSLSPSPIKRPSIVERNSSNHSLSSSSKQTTHKAPRPRVVGRIAHSKQLSHGKNLSKLGRNTSATSLVSDANRNHQRQRSVPTPPTGSEQEPSPIKRNASQVVLPRNALSQVNLRKNHSATALGRNVSHPVLKKSGLAPPLKSHNKLQKPKKKTSTFELGDKSSDEAELEGEEEAEWEDSSASPELTRNNSLTLSQPKPPTSEPAPQPRKPPDPQSTTSPRQSKASFPSELSTHKSNRSAPNLADRAGIASSLKPSGTPEPPTSPALLQYNPRSSRAPPAMSSILAHASNNQLQRNNSSRSFTHITHADASSSKDTLVNPPSHSTIGPHRSSSADGGVSHFLSSSTQRDHVADDNYSDYDSPSNFIPNYHPQPSSSPEQRRSSSKLLRSNVHSRTQQRLELQRRETMRSSASTQSPPPSSDMGFGFGSSASLHSRSGSRGRRDGSAGAGGDVKAVKRDYEATVKQMGVMRRFRNPVLESLQRLKDLGILPPETGVLPPKGASSATITKRPPSRRGLSNASGNSNLNIGGPVTNGISRSLEEKLPSPMASRPSSRGRGVGRVRFQRQGSHDDIGLSRSRGSYEEQEVEDRVDPDEEDPGVSPEEALLRRMWESREIYDPREGVRA